MNRYQVYDFVRGYYWKEYGNTPEVKEWREKKRRANIIIGNMVARGKLISATHLACIGCGKMGAEYHHENYDKPLDVIPLCRKCHSPRDKVMRDSFRASLSIPEIHDFYHSVLNCVVLND